MKNKIVEIVEISREKHGGTSNSDFIAMQVQSMPNILKEAILMRAKSLAKHGKNFTVEYEWRNVEKEVGDIYSEISTSTTAFVAKGGGQIYILSVLKEVCGYQVANVKRICSEVVRRWDGSKSLPPVSFWREVTTSLKPAKRVHIDKTNKLTPTEHETVQDMARRMVEEFGGVGKVAEGGYKNKTTLVRHYGILQYLNMGMVQVQTLDGRDYEWVSKSDVGGREVIDHSKTIELFNSGRISEKMAEKAYYEDKKIYGAEVQSGNI